MSSPMMQIDPLLRNSPMQGGVCCDLRSVGQSASVSPTIMEVHML